jgi:hypothetical protein
MQIKISSYNLIRNPATLDVEVKAAVSTIDTEANDANDTLLLNEVFCDQVDILIFKTKRSTSKQHS